MRTEIGTRTTTAFLPNDESTGGVWITFDGQRVDVSVHAGVSSKGPMTPEDLRDWARVFTEAAETLERIRKVGAR